MHYFVALTVLMMKLDIYWTSLFYDNCEVCDVCYVTRYFQSLV
jgi:hypothetical protein